MSCRVYHYNELTLKCHLFSHNLILFTEATVVAKSSLLIDVKPWDDETDMKELEKLVRTIEMEGLLWGQGKNRFIISWER